jgi:hypothetical protein
MKHRQWKTTRQFLEHPDAGRRWDQAYQCLMSWTQGPAPSPVAERAPQEESDENRRVRSRLHPTPNPDANH